ncbi:O-methyltransferase [Streptomyces roseirectus]|uniref:O-methyltransferase n=1 Tax=Streptomyces roseirectus TaxID=2768066 RepID=A0A7H0IJL2_9ACTN|nr:O-methyltransferase [Streptomyces roseirectus]QNP72978.1 O-methyltransferase [Streptomyces roseirectus]
MSDEQVWSAVDGYVEEELGLGDEVLAAVLRESEAAGLPPISVSAAQGKFLRMLAEIQGARRILEVGTLGGYSTICLARALPEDGRLVTLEYSQKHAEVAERNIARAGLDKVVEIRVGEALTTLPALADEHPDPFDLVFIDADKANNPHYVEWALKLTRAGSVIVVDNVVRDGRVIDADSTASDVQGTRAALHLIATHPRLTGTAIQTVGTKGYDGFALARVVS